MHPYPVRCANCEFLYYPENDRAYLCDVCQVSLEDYVASMGNGPGAVMAWWNRQARLRPGGMRHGAKGMSGEGAVETLAAATHSRDEPD